MRATILHNPRCSKSRETLVLLRDAGMELTVVEYLASPPSRAELARLLDRAGLEPRDALRAGEARGVVPADASGDAVLDAIAADPALLERPLVETERGVRLCRPPERVREIL